MSVGGKEVKQLVQAGSNGWGKISVMVHNKGASDAVGSKTGSRAGGGRDENVEDSLWE